MFLHFVIAKICNNVCRAKNFETVTAVFPVLRNCDKRANLKTTLRVLEIA